MVKLLASAEALDDVAGIMDTTQSKNIFPTVQFDDRSIIGDEVSGISVFDCDAASSGASKGFGIQVWLVSLKIILDKRAKNYKSI